MIQLGLLFIGWIFLKKCTCHFGALPFKLGMIASTNLIFFTKCIYYPKLGTSARFGVSPIGYGLCCIVGNVFWHWGVL